MLENNANKPSKASLKNKPPKVRGPKSIPPRESELRNDFLDDNDAKRILAINDYNFLGISDNYRDKVGVFSIHQLHEVVTAFKNDPSVKQYSIILHVNNDHFVALNLRRYRGGALTYTYWDPAAGNEYADYIQNIIRDLGTLDFTRQPAHGKIQGQDYTDVNNCLLYSILHLRQMRDIKEYTNLSIDIGSSLHYKQYLICAQN